MVFRGFSLLDSFDPDWDLATFQQVESWRGVVSGMTSEDADEYWKKVFDDELFRVVEWGGMNLTPA